MAINLVGGSIVTSFQQSFNSSVGSPNLSDKGGLDIQLFNNTISGGSPNLRRENWTGNTGANPRQKRLRYGFVVKDATSIYGNSLIGGIASAYLSGGVGTSNPLNIPGVDLINRAIGILPGQLFFNSAYYLDIPPQNITQKEIFATNINATRKGIIVETEGVVFKDIIIQGTTGIFPGKRGKFGKGVDLNTGYSTDPSEKTISGYEEFIRLRQFFLMYAAEKVRRNGQLFLVFINQKDNQSLIVEPLEFTMERTSKSPLTYQYRIVLKAIDDYFNQLRRGAFPPNPLEFLEIATSAAYNAQAVVRQSRETINESIDILRQISEGVDGLVNEDLAKLQFSFEDLTSGQSSVLSLPESLARGFTRDNAKNRESLNAGIGARSASIAAPKSKPKPGQGITPSGQTTAEFSAQVALAEKLASDNRAPVSRDQVSKVKTDVKSLADNFSDFLNMGDPLYDQIKGRVPTITPNPLKQANDEELALLGEIENTANTLNLVLASNVSFEDDASKKFSQEASLLNPAGNSQIQIKVPTSVREVRILGNDTLERIAAREYNDANRWLDLVVINSLKPPYISDIRSDGVKKYGDVILVGAD